jgi:lambda repressor-like predicted transcriptional regulator
MKQIPRYLTMSRAFAGASHSPTLLQAAIESIAVLPDPPAPYSTNGFVDGPEMYSRKSSNSPTRPKNTLTELLQACWRKKGKLIVAHSNLAPTNIFISRSKFRDIKTVTFSR